MTDAKIEIIPDEETLPEVIATPAHETSLLEIISRAASDPDVDIEKMERLMEMHERMEDKQAERAFNLAMRDVQSESRPIAADASNPQTKSKYASYMALDRVLRPIYTRHGFSLSFNSSDDAPEGYVGVLAYVGHSDGHTRTYRATMPSDGKGAKGGDVMTKTHATGSAFTYGQRYLLKMIFNVAIGDDDDGNAAGSEPVSHEQLDTLRALIADTDADVKKLCDYFSISNITVLPVAKYHNAIEMLNAKKSKKVEAADE
jgi:hypothetical protein